MSYKGNDLHLRVPDARSGEGTGAELWSSQHPARQARITVDRSVLACANMAHDIAAFHAAREVRIEHLLHALARVDAARDILEQHGVRTGELRRATAAVIAGEAPAAGSGDGRVAPRASAEFAELLRRAAERAGADGVAASVHDLLRALASQAREAPATHLLLAAASDPEQLVRWATEPALGGRMDFNGGAQAAAVALLARVDALETALRDLAAQAAADRSAVLDALAEMQREWRASRPQEAAVGEAQAAVVARLGSLDQAMACLTQRFEAIRVFAPEGEDMAGRLAALETTLAAQPSAIADAVAYMVAEHRPEAEAASAGPGPAERMAALEATVRAHTERLEEAAKARAHEQEEVYEALVKLGANQQTLAGNLEAWRLDNSGDVSIVSNRLENMERTLLAAFPPRPARAVAEGGSLKRWLRRTRQLPVTWRKEAAQLRESLRALRRSAKT